MEKFKEVDIYTYMKKAQKETFIMGILNITPDSFSDGGEFNHLDTAIKQAELMIEQGAKIIDVGGESTRPGAQMVSEEEELKRILPVIEALSSRISVPISIDTYKSKVAREAIVHGASLINDIWGGKYDSEITRVAADFNVPIILMHNRKNKNYGHFMEDVISDLLESIHLSKQNGVEDRQILLDPGVGFAKNFDQNIKVMQNLDQICSIGYPVVLGTSRKSMIGNILNLPAKERVEGSVATVCYGITKGIQIARVHDVLETVRGARVMDILCGKGVV